MKHSLAVISGKGGSGKTMIAAVMASVLMSPKAHVEKSGEQGLLLVDADTATAGLSYYLGLKYLENFSVGLSELARSATNGETVEKSVLLQTQPLLREFEGAQFFGVGSPRLLAQRLPPEQRARLLSQCIRNLKAMGSWMIVDCRGGIDEESIAVCEEVDDIVLIVEPDVTSFQASQHVVEVLSDLGLVQKLRGFIVNKAFDDPSIVARNGISALRCQCLGAIPLDLSAMRSFFVGEVPDIETQFSTQVWAALRKAYSAELPVPPRRPWDFVEFGQTSLLSSESAQGGVLAASLMLLFGSALVAVKVSQKDRVFATNDQLLTIYMVSVMVLLGLAGTLEPGRRMLGRVLRAYLRLLHRGSRRFGKD
jgi:septum site-determining protein MinD